jgi:hypothetical protein
MPAGPAGNVQHPPAGGSDGKKLCHPGRVRHAGGRLWT